MNNRKTTNPTFRDQLIAEIGKLNAQHILGAQAMTSLTAKGHLTRDVEKHQAFLEGRLSVLKRQQNNLP